MLFNICVVTEQTDTSAPSSAAGADASAQSAAKAATRQVGGSSGVALCSSLARVLYSRCYRICCALADVVEYVVP